MTHPAPSSQQHDADDDVVRLPVRRDTRRLIIIGVAVVAGLVALVLAYRAIAFARSHESTDDAQVDGHIVPVLARVGGYVDQVLVDDNSKVDSGQLLVKIDSTDYAVRLAQADAELAVASAAVAQAQAGGRTTVEQQGAASANVEAAQKIEEGIRESVSGVVGDAPTCPTCEE